MCTTYSEVLLRLLLYYLHFVQLRLLPSLLSIVPFSFLVILCILLLMVQVQSNYTIAIMNNCVYIGSTDRTFTMICIVVLL